MSKTELPIGVAIIHQNYPGFIDLPTNSQYLVKNQDIEGSIHLLDHVRPVVITDFNNDLRETPKGKKKLVDLRRAITRIDRDSLSVEGKGHEGNIAPVAVVEKKLTGRIFYQDIYTSLQVCVECTDKQQAQNVLPHSILLKLFLAAYRFLNPDPRLKLTDAIPTATTPMRLGWYQYSDEEKALEFSERIQNAWPENLKPTIISYGEGTRALQTHVGDAVTTNKRGKQLGAFLSSGYSVSPNIVEIEKLAETLVDYDAPRTRAALVEAMSIFEVALIDQAGLVQTKLGSGAKPLLPEGRDQIGWKFLIEKLLPRLLDDFEGEKDPLLSRANSVKELRHKSVHKAYIPTKEELNSALSLIKKVLTIFEMSPDLRVGWKPKSEN